MKFINMMQIIAACFSLDDAPIARLAKLMLMSEKMVVIVKAPCDNVIELSAANEHSRTAKAENEEI